MNKFILLDDSKVDIEKLENVLHQQFPSASLQSFLTFDPVLLKIKDVDIYFIDIEMGEVNGFEVASEIQKEKSDCKIVFCTNYNNLVFHSFELDVFGFIRKNHLEEDVSRTLSKYKRIQNSYYETSKGKILLRNIAYFESAHNYLNIHLMNGTIVKERMSLKQLDMNSLPSFVRISSSFVLNLAWIDLIQQDKIVLKNGEVFYVTRMYRKDFLSAYAKYAMEK